MLLPRIHTLGSALVIVVSALLAGCGKPAGNATVKGEVTYDGKPIESGVISFYPIDPTGGSGGGGIEDGKYDVKGLNAGRYKMKIVLTQEGDAEEIPSGGARRSEMNKQRLKEARVFTKSQKRARIPASSLTSEQQVELVQGENLMNFELKKK
jgi:hypothetical protein